MGIKSGNMMNWLGMTLLGKESENKLNVLAMVEVGTMGVYILNGIGIV